jgi:hypothetical protein
MNVKISDICTYTITDLEMVKEAEDGGKFKKNIKDPKTGVSYQEYSHLSDAFDYFHCEAYKSKFREYTRGKVTMDRDYGLKSQENKY